MYTVSQATNRLPKRNPILAPAFGGVNKGPTAHPRHSKLPTRSELDAFDAELKANRALPDEVVQVIRLSL